MAATRIWHEIWLSIQQEGEILYLCSVTKHEILQDLALAANRISLQ